MTLPLPIEIERPATVGIALTQLSMQGSVEDRGAVFTRAEVVEGILDLCSYSPDRDLQKTRLLEPAFGNGDFLLPAVRRLLASCRRQKLPHQEWPRVLSDAIFAVELHQPTFAHSRALLMDLLGREGLSQISRNQLVSGWLKQDDYLLTDIVGRFDVILGNPPYVRQERIASALIEEYKHAFTTFYDRADLYVLFYERSLDLLSEKGVLGFICANRWVKNKFGGPLRAKVASNFNLDVYIDLEQVDAFQNQVDAYPAITIIRRTPPKKTAVVIASRDGGLPLKTVFSELKHSKSKKSPNITIVRGLMKGREPWLFEAREIVELMRALERRLPTLEESGAKVGIGVATGYDRVYIGQYKDLPVENERKLPLALASDLKGGTLNWGGRGLVNPWTSAGALASLDDFPRFATYLRSQESSLRARHTARQNPSKWYKTIDRVYPDLTHTPKLLIPDIKGQAAVAYDSGKYYPHHNLYVVTSSTWDLQALQALLRSSLALMFVAAYSIRMAGGFLRFQAQYLRRIRVPHWRDLDIKVRAELHNASTLRNQEKLDFITAKAYGIPKEAAALIREFAAKVRVPNIKK